MSTWSQCFILFSDYLKSIFSQAQKFQTLLSTLEEEVHAQQPPHIPQALLPWVWAASIKHLGKSGRNGQVETPTMPSTDPLTSSKLMFFMCCWPWVKAGNTISIATWSAHNQGEIHIHVYMCVSNQLSKCSLSIPKLQAIQPGITGYHWVQIYFWYWSQLLYLFYNPHFGKKYFAPGAYFWDVLSPFMRICTYKDEVTSKRQLCFGRMLQPPTPHLQLFGEE